MFTNRYKNVKNKNYKDYFIVSNCCHALSEDEVYNSSGSYYGYCSECNEVAEFGNRQN